MERSLATLNNFLRSAKPSIAWILKLSAVHTPRRGNTGLVSSGASLTSWGECASLALVGHPSSDSVRIKILYGVDVLFHWPELHPTESDFIVRSVETGIGRWMLVVAVISVDVHLFLAFSDLIYCLEDAGIVVFWLHCATW